MVRRGRKCAQGHPLPDGLLRQRQRPERPFDQNGSDDRPSDIDPQRFLQWHLVQQSQGASSGELLFTASSEPAGRVHFGYQQK